MNQIDKNTVKADNQLKIENMISYIHPNGNGIKVLFVGNSITRHGPKPDIGWNNDWGMAASSPAHDYVHLVADHVLKTDRGAGFCVCQVAEWERNCYNGETVFDLFQAARDFAADIIIMRIAENCPHERYERDLFQREYEKLLNYLDPTGKARKILTSAFWKCNEDEGIRLLAQSRGYTMVELGDLGECDDMKAIGLYEHTGVANHPGDLGMYQIAERIIQAIEQP